MNVFIANNPWLSFIIFYLIFIVLLAWRNYHQFMDKKYKGVDSKKSLFHNKLWHSILAIFISWITAPVCLFLFQPDFLQLLATQVFACFLMWNIFEPVYNGFTGMKFFYRGSVAFTDTLNLPNWIYFAVKFGGLIASIWWLTILF